MADQYIAAVNNHLDNLDGQLRGNPYVHKAAMQSGVRPSLIVGGGLSALLLFLLAGLGAKFLTNLIGFAYPLYASFKALKTPSTEDDGMWLTYWVVYGFFTLIESATDFFLYWIPFYHLFKLGFLIYLYAPQTRGAQHIYKQFIEPVLNKYQGEIDRDVTRVRQEASSFTSSVASDNTHPKNY